MIYRIRDAVGYSNYTIITLYFMYEDRFIGYYNLNCSANVTPSS